MFIVLELRESTCTKVSLVYVQVVRTRQHIPPCDLHYARPKKTKSVTFIGFALKSLVHAATIMESLFTLRQHHTPLVVDNSNRKNNCEYKKKSDR